MRRILTLFAAVVVGLATTVFNTAPAFAHGYVNSPPSRQANCAQGKVPDCGPIIYEPQSVEGPKGLRSCHANLPQFAQLSDESKPWPVASVGGTATFTWTFTVQHATRDFEYYIGGTRVAVFDGGGRQPPPTVSHPVDLSRFSGRQKILAIWNIADTTNAFYSCIDVNIGGGNDPGRRTRRHLDRHDHRAHPPARFRRRCRPAGQDRPGARSRRERS
ncbi:hypothetical protein E1295_47565, partial [Nonomuraea mesophila]